MIHLYFVRQRWLCQDNLVLLFPCRYVGNIKNLESLGMVFWHLPSYKIQALLRLSLTLEEDTKVGT